MQHDHARRRDGLLDMRQAVRDRKTRVTSARVRVLREPCDACPFKGRFLGLEGDRLRRIIDECRRDDAVFACHKTVDYTDDEQGNGVVFGPAAVCAGWRAIGDVPSVLAAGFQLDAIEWVDPP
jgi:hypothetical protein